MKLEQLRRKLLAAARANTPSDRVPHAFEKRILARLALQPLPDVWSYWAVALWRAAVPCLAVALLVWAVSFFGLSRPASVRTANEEFSPEFERTMLVAVDQSGEVW